MSLSFQEKSLWLMFVSLIVAFSFYFATVLPTDAVNVMPHQVVLFTLAIVLLVIVQVAGHVIIAIMDRQTKTDERDKLIALKGTRNAAYTLAVVVFCALCVALLTPGNFIFVHVLLGGWVLAQLVEIGSQLFLYRRGA
jgi:hypothetical protein